MANIYEWDPATGQKQKVVAEYPPAVLVELGIKHLTGQIYTAVVRTNPDGYKTNCTYNSAVHGKQFPIVFVHRIVGCLISPVDRERIQIGEQYFGQILEPLYFWKSLLVNGILRTSFPCFDLLLQIWQMIHSRCLPLKEALQCIEGLRAVYIFTTCLNLKMLEAESMAIDCIIERAKAKMVQQLIVQAPQSTPVPQQTQTLEGNVVMHVILARAWK